MTPRTASLRPRLLVISCALVLAAAAPARAAIENAGTTAANFLSVGSGAGILGMGGATLGAGSDLNAVNWNVASLGWMDETQYAISHAGLGDQSLQEWAAAGGRLRYMDARWSVSGLYQGDGSFEGRDAAGNPTGSFGASSMAFGAAFARPFGERVTVGLGARFVSEKLGDVSGIGATFDGGVQVRSGMVGVGLAAQSLGGQMRYGGVPYRFPANVGLGVAITHPKGVRAALDLNFPYAYYSDVRVGVEYRWQDRLAIRTGYRHELGAASGEPLSGPTFGMGAGVQGLWLDYGYLVGGAGEGQHRLGLTFHPGGIHLGSGEPLGYRSAEPSTRAPVASAPQKKSATAQAPKSTETAAPKEKVKAPAPAKTQQSSAPIMPPVSSPKPAALPPATKAAPVAPAPKPSTDLAMAVAPTPAPAAAAARPTTTVPAPGAAPTSAAPVVTAITPPNAPPAESAPVPAVTPVTPPAQSAATPTVTQVAPPAQSAPAPAVTPSTTPAQSAPARAVTPSTTPAQSAPAPAVTPVTLPAQSAPSPAPSVKAVPAPATGAPALKRPAKIKVKQGDDLRQIALRYGTTVAAIMMENNLTNDRIRPGQVLKIPNHR